MSYVCVECMHPVSSLFVTYQLPSNASLLQCPKCKSPALDHYIQDVEPLLLLDLLLLRKSLYRHVLFNRNREAAYERRREELGMAAVVLGLDAFVRFTKVRLEMSAAELVSTSASALFLTELAFSLIETASLIGSLALAGYLLHAASRMISTAPGRQIKFLAYGRLPLTVLYASLPSLLILVMTTLVWPDEYLPRSSMSGGSSPPWLASSLLSSASSSSSSSDSDSDLAPWTLVALRGIKKVGRSGLRSGVTRVGSVAGWASEAVVRKGVGGTSLAVGVSVLLDAGWKRTLLVLALAWGFHLTILNGVDAFLVQGSRLPGLL